MAILSDYTAGTVSVSAGGTAVTGVGTGWLTAGFREGDMFIAADWLGVIASVNSNTSLTLYPVGRRGAALSGAPYRLRYMSDGSRASAQARQLIDLLGGSGNLQAFGGLSGTANQFGYFTGAGTMALTPLTAFARSILDDASATDVLNTLNVIGNAQATRLPGGAILQWNSTVINVWGSEGEATIPLLQAYSNATSYTVQLHYGSPNSNATRAQTVIFDTTLPRTASQFSVRGFNMATGVPFTGGARRIEWIAVGY